MAWVLLNMYMINRVSSQAYPPLLPSRLPYYRSCRIKSGEVILQTSYSVWRKTKSNLSMGYPFIKKAPKGAEPAQPDSTSSLPPRLSGSRWRAGPHWKVWWLDYSIFNQHQESSISPRRKLYEPEASIALLQAMVFNITNSSV